MRVRFPRSVCWLLLAVTLAAGWEPPGAPALAANPPLTLAVDSAGDAAGQPCTAAAADCSLRSAIELANANPGSTILFDASRTITLGGALPIIAAAGTTVRAAIGQTVVVNAAGAPAALAIAGDQIRIEGLYLYGAAQRTIHVELKLGERVSIARNVIGNDATAACNGTGTDYGLYVEARLPPDALTHGLWAYGNRIECHQGPIGAGVAVDGASRVRIGANEAGTAGAAELNTIRANRVGALLSNGALANLVTNNVLSGNLANGVRIEGDETRGNAVTSNRIGVNAAGQLADPNSGTGIIIDAALGNEIGAAGQGNLISGNLAYGIRLRNGAGQNSIQGNTIGANAAGDAPLPNRMAGILIEDSVDTLIGGGTLADLNIIAGNLSHGIVLSGTGTTRSRISFNDIGYNSRAAVIDGRLANAGHGLLITAGARGNLIGPSGQSAPLQRPLAPVISRAGLLDVNPAANFIAFNRQDGIALNGAGANQIRSNSISGNLRGISINATEGTVISRTLVYFNPGGGIIELNADNNVWSELGVHSNGARSLRKAGELGPPQITAVTRNRLPLGSTTLFGISQSRFWVEVYASDLGGVASGRRFLGRTQARDDGSWSLTLPADRLAGLPASCFTAFHTTTGRTNSSEFGNAACLYFLPGVTR
ncbi:MAG TPA: hypothetical protein VGE07_24920 [Herpetosiphonaceae bacterium]